jgi:hypothetical protein
MYLITISGHHAAGNQAEAADPEQGEQTVSEGVRQLCSLAEARDKSHQNRTYQELTGDEFPDDILHEGHSSRTSVSHARDPGSRVTIRGHYTQKDVNPFTSHPTHRSDIVGEPSPHRQPARTSFLDTDQYGFLSGSPLQQSRQFCEDHELPHHWRLELFDGEDRIPTASSGGLTIQTIT